MMLMSRSICVALCGSLAPGLSCMMGTGSAVLPQVISKASRCPLHPTFYQNHYLFLILCCSPAGLEDLWDLRNHQCCVHRHLGNH